MTCICTRSRSRRWGRRCTRPARKSELSPALAAARPGRGLRCPALAHRSRLHHQHRGAELLGGAGGYHPRPGRRLHRRVLARGVGVVWALRDGRFPASPAASRRRRPGYRATRAKPRRPADPARSAASAACAASRPASSAAATSATSRSSREGTGEPGVGRIESTCGVSAGSAACRARRASTASSRCARVEKRARDGRVHAAQRAAGQAGRHSMRRQRRLALQPRAQHEDVRGAAGKRGLQRDRRGQAGVEEALVAHAHRRAGQQRQRGRGPHGGLQRGGVTDAVSRSTASPVLTAVAIGCSSVRTARAAANRPGESRS